MKHLVKDLYVDADQYQFIIKRKSTIKSGDNKGSVNYTNELYPASTESVMRYIENMSAMEWVNGDWVAMTKYFEEARANFMIALPELIKKRNK